MFSRRTRTVGVAGVVALALVAAQAAFAEVPVTRLTPADQAAAKAAVLTLADFGAGAGWTGGLQKSAKAFTTSTCPGLWDPKQADLVITGVAKSEFHTEGANVSSGVQVYKTARMAQLDWDRTVVAPAALRCMKKLSAATESPTFRVVSIKSTPFPRVGRAAFRVRMVAEYTVKGAPVRVVIDQIAFGRGRTGISITFAVPYADRAAADAAEVRLARTLNSRIRV